MTVNKKAKSSVIDQRTLLSLSGVAVLFSAGLVFSYSSFILKPEGQLGVAFILLILMAVLIGWQAWKKGSIAVSVLLALSSPVGFWIGMRTRDIALTTPQAWSNLHLGVTIGLFVGLPAHLIGMELSRRYDTAGRKASYREQLVLIGLWVAVIAFFFITA